MKVRCYPEGESEKAVSYDVEATSYASLATALAQVATRYVREEVKAPYGRAVWSSTANICVEPDDAQARAMDGWHPLEDPNDPEERPYRMFVVESMVTVKWDAREVQTFHLRAGMHR